MSEPVPPSGAEAPVTFEEERRRLDKVVTRLESGEVCLGAARRGL